MSGNNRTQGPLDPGSCALLKVGPLKLRGTQTDLEHEAGVSDPLELTRLSPSTNGDWEGTIEATVGKGNVTFVCVPETRYEFVLLNGAVQPVIVDWRSDEVWRIEGLGRHFSKSCTIYPGKRRIGFSADEADMGY